MRYGVGIRLLSLVVSAAAGLGLVACGVTPGQTIGPTTGQITAGTPVSTAGAVASATSATGTPGSVTLTYDRHQYATGDTIKVTIINT